jgi:hypothetical protein
LLPFAAKAQILSAPEGLGFTHVPKFDPTFILENDIAEIKAVMETKKDGDRIRKTNRTTTFQFDALGQSALVAQINNKLQDTSVVAYQFVDRSNGSQGRRIACEVKNDPAGMYSYCYSYDVQGLPAERRYARVESWRSKLQADFAAKATKINTETYSHTRYENQLHSTLFNSSARPYQKEIRYFDDDGYLLKYLRSFVMTSERHEEVYTYNGQGRLATCEITHGRDPHRLSYVYDEVGNLLSEERHEGEVLSYRKEFVYEGSNMLLRAELLRREMDEVLEIISYTYTFE